MTAEGPARLLDLLSALARQTGFKMGRGEFDNRLRTQKVVYLLKAMGEPVASQYDWSLYIRGPYSPALARGYYHESVPPVSDYRVPERMASVIQEACRRGNDFLEAATTLHFVAARNPGSTYERVRNHVVVMKPRLERVLDEAWAYLERHGLVAGR